MTDILKSLGLHYRFEITKAIRSGSNIEAIKLYREATGCDLASAYKAIELTAAQLRTANPYAFERHESPGIAWKWLMFFGLGALIAVLFDRVQDFDFGRFQEDAQQILQETPLFNALTQNESTALKTYPVKAPLKAPVPAPLPTRADPHEPEDDVYRPVMPKIIERDIKKLYQQKLANPDYRHWLDLPGLPKGYQDYPEEHAIKYARAQIAREISAPSGQKVESVPLHSNLKIDIDGAINPLEWQGAKRFALSPDTAGTVLYLQADTEWLYIACDALEETTEDGYDQLRFYFHIDIDPAIINERIHLGRFGKRLGGIRQTTMLRPVSDNNDRRNGRPTPLSDWQIFRMARGATQLSQHRQYEAKLHLAESGLHYGVPFPVFVEVETDPLQVNGKFKQRQYLGKLGSQKRPVWLLIK